MTIRVRCYGDVREALDTELIELDLSGDLPVTDVLDRLASEADDFEKLRADREIVVMRDGSHLGVDSPTKDGDVLSITTSPMPE